MTSGFGLKQAKRLKPGARSRPQISVTPPPNSSIFGHRRINLVGPVDDAPLQVLYRRKALLAEKRRRFRAAAAHLAMHDDFLVLRNLLIPLRHFAERNQRRAWNAPDL